MLRRREGGGDSMRGASMPASRADVRRVPGVAIGVSADSAAWASVAASAPVNETDPKAKCLHLSMVG